MKKMHIKMSSGLLPINKPAGMSSKDISRWLVKRTGKIKMGHVGTLDPFAEGVLPIVIGKATRLQDYLLENKKIYRAHLKLGEATNTLDKDGDVILRKTYDQIKLEDLKEKSKSFCGSFEQEPPIFSAIKYKGRPLYDYALKGEQDKVPLKDLKKKVTVFSFEVESFRDGIAQFLVAVSKGTYIRSLALQLAESLNTTGHLVKLVRLESSGLDISQTYTLNELEDRIKQGTEISSYLLPFEKLALSLPIVEVLELDTFIKIMHGQKIGGKISSIDNLFSVFNYSFNSFSGSHCVLLKNMNKQICAIANFSFKQNTFIFKIQRSLI